MIIKHPAAPKINLMNLLKRRKATLLQWTSESGIHTYDQLVRHCNLMGIIPPEKEEFEKISPKNITVATEGIVIVDIEPSIEPSEKTDVPVMEDVESIPELTEEMFSKSRRVRQKKQLATS